MHGHKWPINCTRTRPEGEKNKRPIPPNASDHSKLPFAQYKGTPRPEGDLTRDSIRQARAQHEAAKKARGSAVAAEEACCTCVCPPSQGFGNAWNIPASEARKHPFVKNGEPTVITGVLSAPMVKTDCR